MNPLTVDGLMELAFAYAVSYAQDDFPNRDDAQNSLSAAIESALADAYDTGMRKGAVWGLAKVQPKPEPVAWRYQDSRGNFRYRGYVSGFDREYDILKPVALYEHPAPQPAVPLNLAGETPYEHAHRWATELAVSMARKFYPEVTQWKPLPDLVGVITQIDNMSTGLVRAPGVDVARQSTGEASWVNTPSTR